MRVLMLSKEGDGLGVAHRLTMQDHKVMVWIKEPRFARAGRGIVDRIDSWREGLGKADLIICDMVGFGMLEQTLRSLGKPTISCSHVLEQAELNRGLGMQLFNTAKIAIPETYQCPDEKAAADLLSSKDFEHGWVLKPDGNKSTAKTLLVKDKEELSWAIEQVKGGSLIVQQIVEGVEVSTEGWFNGRDFLRPFNHTFEEKKFLHGNLGPTVGCMGNIVFGVSSNKLTRATIERLKPFLSTIGYRGPVDINTIVDERKAYALEITARMGYDAIEALLEGLREPAIDLFFEVAMGTKKEMRLTEDTMIAVRLSVPPWPMAKPKEGDAASPCRIPPEVEKHIAITDLYREKGEFWTAGGDGVLLKATACGVKQGITDYVSEARKRVYRSLDNIKVPGKQYRLDIGERANKDWKRLKDWGWVQ